jgi:hypothetical protein
VTVAQATARELRSARAPWVAGFGVWLVALAALPAPIVARILLVAPLVIVPRLLGMTQFIPIRQPGGWVCLAVAFPLVAAFALPVGPVAAALATPWLAFALVVAVASARDAFSRIRSLVTLIGIPALGIRSAPASLAIGAGFIVVHRLGFDVMGFSPTIILLTATHFHFAGFGLLAVASVLAERRIGVRLVVVTLIAGIPLTALGFTLASTAVSAAGALLVGCAGLGVAFAMMTERGALLRVAGAALTISMPLGIAWSLAAAFGVSFLGLDTMVRTHGALNAAAIVVAAAGIDPLERIDR